MCRTDVRTRLVRSFRGLLFIIIFFFFQAEDGIRDYKVTGVQTCALPIFRLIVRAPSLERGGRDRQASSARGSSSSQAYVALRAAQRSEEHTSESSHLVISYAVFCLKKKKQHILHTPLSHAHLVVSCATVHS